MYASAVFSNIYKKLDLSFFLYNDTGLLSFLGFRFHQLFATGSFHCLLYRLLLVDDSEVLVNMGSFNIRPKAYM